MKNRRKYFYALYDPGTGAHHEGVGIDGPHLGLGRQVPLSDDVLGLLGSAVEPNSSARSGGPNASSSVATLSPSAHTAATV